LGLECYRYGSDVAAKGSTIVVDNIRTSEQLEHFRRKHDWNIVHAHLYAPRAELERRFKNKNDKRTGETAANYTEADLLKNETDVVHFKEDADVRINTGRTDGRDTLVRVAARLAACRT
jgi:adenylosuccinate synthase